METYTHLVLTKLWSHTDSSVNGVVTPPRPPSGEYGDSIHKSAGVIGTSASCVYPI